MAREFSKQFYNSKLWQNTRDYILKRDKYLCVKCGRPAEEVHHITHLSPNNINDLTVTVNPDNLISLCKDCHFEQHRGEHGSGRKVREDNGLPQYEFDEDGFLVCIH